MIVTEEKAKGMWCPHGRHAIFPDGDGGGNHDSKCVASNCMSWRWAIDDQGEPSYEITPKGGGHFEHAPRGYCGLAGKP